MADIPIGKNFRSWIAPIKIVLKNSFKTKKNGFSQIIITTEPLDLRSGIPVDDIAFFILEVPRDNNENVSFADPDFLFYFSLDSPHPRYAVKTADTYMVCTHHQFSTPEHLPVSFLGSFTLMISSPGGDPGFLSVSTTSPLFSRPVEVRFYVLNF